MLDPPIVRVYLAASLTNVDPQTRELCTQLREVIKRILEAYDHNGVRFTVYDPGAVTPPGSIHDDEEVYCIDHHETATADLVIFLLLAPSLGVGIESQIAADATVPRVLVTQPDSKVSRMFKGLFSPIVTAIECLSPGDLEVALSRRMPAIAEYAIQSAVCRHPLMRDLESAALPRLVRKLRIRRGLTIAELSRQTDIREFWLRQFDCEPSRTGTFTLMQFLRIGDALKCTMKTTVTNVPTFEPIGEQLELVDEESLNNLIAATDQIRADEHDYDDARVRDLWTEHVEQRTGAIIRREKPVGVDVWVRRYADRPLF